MRCKVPQRHHQGQAPLLMLSELVRHSRALDSAAYAVAHAALNTRTVCSGCTPCHQHTAGGQRSRNAGGMTAMHWVDGWATVWGAQVTTLVITRVNAVCVGNSVGDTLIARPESPPPAHLPPSALCPPPPMHAATTAGGPRFPQQCHQAHVALSQLRVPPLCPSAPFTLLSPC
jgi:hypothetical protein